MQRSYEKRGSGEVSRFCGWRTLSDLVKKAERPMVKGLIATLFETGCRVSESIMLTPEMFIEEEGFITAYGVPVLKKGKVDPTLKRRNIPIPIEEPLVPTMMDWVEDCRTERLFPRSRDWCYKQIRKVDPDWWCHRLRTERATQLVVEYGFNVPQLQRWFNWSDTKTPTNYVRLRVEDLKEAMRRK